MTKDGLIGDLVGMRFRDVDRVARWTRDELRSLPPGPGWSSVLELRAAAWFAKCGRARPGSTTPVEMEDRGSACCAFERGHWEKSIAVFTVRVE